MAYGFDDNKVKVTVEGKYLIWTNSDPGDTFAQQTVQISNVNEDDYDFFEIITRNGQVCKVLAKSSVFPYDKTVLQQTYINYITHMQELYSRKFTISYLEEDNKVLFSFENCYEAALYSGTSVESVENDSLIPYLIYGIKL